MQIKTVQELEEAFKNNEEVYVTSLELRRKGGIHTTLARNIKPSPLVNIDKGVYAVMASRKKLHNTYKGMSPGYVISTFKVFTDKLEAIDCFNGIVAAIVVKEQELITAFKDKHLII